MRLIPILCWALAAAAGSAAAAPPPDMTASEAAATQQTGRIGALIFAYDRAAWVGTDDLVAKMPDFGSRIGGWIVDGPAEAPRLVFHDRDPVDPKIVYTAEFQGTRLVSSRVLGEGDDRSLSAERKAMIAAKRAASQALTAGGKLKRCKKDPFNTVVLPPAAPGGPTAVYFLTPQTAKDAIPMGGHFLVEIGADGRAAAPRRFSNSCMEMPFTRKKKGERPEALMITHLLDAAPTEIHVFSSLAAGLPIFVATTVNGRLWAVQGSRISLQGGFTRGPGPGAAPSEKR